MWSVLGYDWYHLTLKWDKGVRWGKRVEMGVCVCVRERERDRRGVCRKNKEIRWYLILLTAVSSWGTWDSVPNPWSSSVLPIAQRQPASEMAMAPQVLRQEVTCTLDVGRRVKKPGRGRGGSHLGFLSAHSHRSLQQPRKIDQKCGVALFEDQMHSGYAATACVLQCKE